MFTLGPHVLVKFEQQVKDLASQVGSMGSQSKRSLQLMLPMQDILVSQRSNNPCLYRRGMATAHHRQLEKIEACGLLPVTVLNVRFASFLLAEFLAFPL